MPRTARSLAVLFASSLFLAACGGASSASHKNTSSTSSTSSTSAHTVTGFAYVANFTDDTVSQYTIGPNGELTPMSPATVAAGDGPWSLTVDPQHKYVYVADFTGTAVSQYTIGPDGALTPMSPPTVAVGTSGQYAASVAVNPSDTYAYVVTEVDDTIAQFSIGPDGALTLKATTTDDPGTYPDTIAIAPSGGHAYVSNLRVVPTPGELNFNMYTIAQYTIDPTTGALTLMSPATVVAASGPRSVVIDPSANYAYAVCFDNGNVAQYSIGSDGALVPISPPTVAAGPDAISIAVDPSGPYVYVANSGAATLGDDISEYSIGSDGALTPMSPATVAAGEGANAVTVDPSGKYVYVTNSTGANVSQFTIGTNGVLTPMSQPTVPAGNGPTAITTVER